MTNRYEAPDMLELGDATQLTLGTNGDCPDNCACSLAGSEDEREIRPF